MVEQRRENKEKEENPRLNIGRHDEVHVHSFLNPSHLHPQIEVPSASSAYTALLRIVRQSSGTIKNLRSHLNIDITKAPFLGHLSHNLLSTSRKATCDKLSITSNLSPYIYAEMPHSSSFLPSFLAMQFPLLPLLHTIYRLPPKYTPYSHISSPDIYTQLYKSAITAPTTPNNPTPTFTLPAAFFPVVLAAVPAPELVLLGLPLPVALALVFVPLALALVVVIVL